MASVKLIKCHKPLRRLSSTAAPLPSSTTPNARRGKDKEKDPKQRTQTKPKEGREVAL